MKLPTTGRSITSPLAQTLTAFAFDGKSTVCTTTQADSWDGQRIDVPTFTNEFWTARQRAGHSLHEISYRACFKPQLPQFFITRLTQPGDRVYDCFMGRGTTVLEAALLGRRVAGSDINPLSSMLVAPRLTPPSVRQVETRLADIDLCRWPQPIPEDLLVFYHPDTLVEICALRGYLLHRKATASLDDVDGWINMVAVNRLAGHSSGFFSVYTLPPNQAVSVARQRKINAERCQTPPRRNVKALILRKTTSLLADCNPAVTCRLRNAAADAILCTAPADRVAAVPTGSVTLVVTSPPFLDTVNYKEDNWLRCWFCGIDVNEVPITMTSKLAEWEHDMSRVFVELHRIVRPGGHVAFEVGDVRGGTVMLEESVIRAATAAGFVADLLMVNSQAFTKTSHCWGVGNNKAGTNTNRIVLLKRP